MTATLYAFPGCNLDPAEDTVSDTEWAREHVDHPSYCERINDYYGNDGLIVHRVRVGGADELPVVVERFDGPNGGRDSLVRLGEDLFSPEEIRALIMDLWAAHDLAGGAK